MESSTSAKKEKATSSLPPAEKVKSADDLRETVKLVHDQSTKLGGVSKHTTMESKANSPLKVNLNEWDEEAGEGSELQKSARSLESKQKTQDSATSVKYAKSVVSQVDLHLEDGATACDK